MTEDEKPTPDEPEEAPAAEEAPPRSPSERPADMFKKGVGLLWQAARAAGEDIKKEVEKGDVQGQIQQAARDLEDAANQAAKALETFIERVGPTPKKQRGESPWDEPKSEDAASDGGPKKDDGDDDGHMRIQVGRDD